MDTLTFVLSTFRTCIHAHVYIHTHTHSGTLTHIRHWIRLSSNHNNFDDTWVADDSVCYGHNPDDLQPWTGELFGLEGTTPLSNTELYALMSPGTDQMPYVYDNYEWPHCTAQGFDMTYTGDNAEYFVSLYDDTLS